MSVLQTSVGKEKTVASFLSISKMINWCLWERMYVCTSSDAVVSAVTNMVTLDGLRWWERLGKSRRETINRCNWGSFPSALIKNYLVLLFDRLVATFCFFSRRYFLFPIVETICPITFDTSRHKNTFFNDNHLQRHLMVVTTAIYFFAWSVTLNLEWNKCSHSSEIVQFFRCLCNYQ